MASQLVMAWQIAAGLLALVVTWELAWGVARAPPIAIERHADAVWPVGVAQTVTLALSRQASARRWAGPWRRVAGRLFDHAPAEFELTGMPVEFAVPKDGELQIRYQARATQRGSQPFGPVEVWLDSPGRLIQWRYRLTAAGASRQGVKVYPDFARIAQFAFLSIDHRLAQIGVMRRRRRGEGMEFHQLREYRPGDSPRQIDWKATARQGKMISREYQDERNQQIVFLLDCGQRMRSRERGAGDHPGGQPLSHFDHAVNALLLLSYVALRQGDGVGLSTFAHPQARHLAPRRSQATLLRLLDAVYDLEPSRSIPDFVGAARDLVVRVHKRSLVVIITNLRDEDRDGLDDALTLLRRWHHVVVASLREPGLVALIERPVARFRDALAFAAATEYLLARRRAVAAMRSRGVRCLDVAPPQLPIALVNQYLAMKRGGEL